MSQTTDIAAIREALAKATPGDLSTAERHIINEYVECPFCQGDGEIGATDYCNFDGVALGVQFYGIGKEFGAHEKLWVAVVKSLPTMADEIEALRAEVDRLRGTADDASPSHRRSPMTDETPVAWQYENKDDVFITTKREREAVREYWTETPLYTAEQVHRLTLAAKIEGAELMREAAVKALTAFASNCRMELMIERYGDEATMHASEQLQAANDYIRALDAAAIAGGSHD